MGKGGGCVPSKKKLATEASDRDLPIPGSYVPITALSEPEDIRRNPVQKSAIHEEESVKKLRIFIIFYSMYGHVELLARRMKKGVDSIDGVEGVLFRVPETLPRDVLEQMRVSQKSDEVAVISAEELVRAD